MLSVASEIEQEQEPIDLTIGEVPVDFAPPSKFMSQRPRPSRHHAALGAEHPEDRGMREPVDPDAPSLN